MSKSKKFATCSDSQKVLCDFYHNIFRVRLRECRIARGMTQKELAELAGFESKVSVTRIENGIASVTVPRLCLLARALRVNPEYLIGFTDERSF